MLTFPKMVQTLEASLFSYILVILVDSPVEKAQDWYSQTNTDQRDPASSKEKSKFTWNKTNLVGFNKTKLSARKLITLRF